MKNKFRGLRLLSIGLLIVLAISLIGCGSKLDDGTYSAQVYLDGGSGRASIETPTTITVTDGQTYATIVWSSSNYDYMIVGETQYLNENVGGNSTFTIPVEDIDKPLEVIADTTAMSTPHEIDYTITFELEE